MPLDAPEATYIKGRELPAAPADAAVDARIHEWLRFCDDKHDCCNAAAPPLLPTRVVDVGPSDGSQAPFLYETRQNERGLYVALSYCWGTGQATVTTRQNLAAHKQRLDLPALARSLQDAVSVTRRLSQRYVWIDALCIVQREPNLADFRVESLKMAQYYSNAYVPISAACSSDSRDSFLHQRPPAPATPCQVPCRSDDGAAFMVTLGVDESAPIYRTGPIDARAWTYQERVLSARLLIFTARQAIFECQHTRFFEQGYCRHISRQYGRPTAIPWSLVEEMRLCSLASTTGAAAVGSSEIVGGRASVHRLWASIVSLYSARRISDANDRMTALAGVAQVLRPHAGGLYIWGLWATNFVAGLLWRRGLEMTLGPTLGKTTYSSTAFP
jgi:hypothetical protein